MKMASNGNSLGFAKEDSAGENELGIVERRMLEKGKKEHRETTQATERALKVSKVLTRQVDEPVLTALMVL